MSSYLISSVITKFYGILLKQKLDREDETLTDKKSKISKD